MNSSLLIDDQPVSPRARRIDLALAIRLALEEQTGFAAGKLGVSEQAMLAFPFLLERCSSSLQRNALTVQTQRHCAASLGLFPSDTDSILQFSSLHADAVRSLDFLGLVKGRLEADVLDFLDYTGRTLSLLDFEPDRSLPDNSAACYLPELSGMRVLIISSIAELLCRRANHETFTTVWAKTGKPWFAPGQVTSLQFPYTYDSDTQRHFGSSVNLLESVIEQIDSTAFDVALVAGASLGIPLAAAIKGMNRSAIALGGALQVLFGVQGKRWRENPEWVENYFTDAWIEIPADQVPKMPAGYCEDGAYW